MRGVMAVVVLLALPAVAGQAWHVPGGQPEQSGTIDATGFFDVEAAVDLLPAGFDSLASGSPVVVTDHGVAALARIAQEAPAGDRPVRYTCQVSLWDGSTTRGLGDRFPCDDPSQGARPGAPAAIAGYDPVLDEIWICAGDGGAEPLLIFSLPEARLVDRLGPGDAMSWTCRSPGWDPIERRLCVPFFSEGAEARVSIIGLDGKGIIWSSPVGPRLNLSITGVSGGSSALLPLACAATTTGYVITLDPRSPETTLSGIPDSGVAFQTYDRDGRPMTFFASALTDTPPMDQEEAISSTSWLSGRPAVRGAEAIFLLGDRLHRIDPSISDVLYERVSSTGAWISNTASAAWSDGVAVMPTGYGWVVKLEGKDNVHVFDPRGYRVAAVAIMPDSKVLSVGLANPSAPDEKLYVQVFNPETRLVEQRLDVRIPVDAAYNSWIESPTITALAHGRLLVVDPTTGHGAVIGPTSGRPPVASDRYPPIGGLVSLHPGDEGSAYQVSWGDGVIADYAAPPFEHRYTREDDFEAVVTAIQADGTSRTGTVLIHPGTPEPVRLNALQRAFAPENQEVTFSLLGIAVTLLAAVLAAAVRWRMRSRLATHFAGLDRIREQGRSDPLPAVTSLAAFRAGMRELLTRGRLTDTQFAAVEVRARDVLESLRKRLLGPLASALSPRFEAMLDAALEDGHLSGAERGRLDVEMARASMARDQERQVQAILDQVG